MHIYKRSTPNLKIFSFCDSAELSFADYYDYLAKYINKDHLQ